MSRAWIYIPLTQLKQRHPYQITNLSERNGDIWLMLKDHEEPREIRSLLMPRSYHDCFKALWQLNREWDGEEAQLIIKNYGQRPNDGGGVPVFTISGRRFTAFLV